MEMVKVQYGTWTYKMSVQMSIEVNSLELFLLLHI